MGQVSDIEVNDGEAVKVATGGMVPKGADAVEMVEYTEWVDSHTLHVFKTLSPLENVIQMGEDIKAGESSASQRTSDPTSGYRPHGRNWKDRCFCISSARVGIISSGDEIVPIEDVPDPWRDQRYQSLHHRLHGKETGGIPIFLGIAKDRFERSQGED